MSDQQNLAALNTTLKALPEREAKAIAALATASPDIADDIHERLRASFGEAAATKLGMKELASAKANWANNKQTTPDALVHAIATANNNTFDVNARKELAQNVSALTGMDAQAALTSLDRLKGQDEKAYLSFKDALTPKMDAVTKAAAAKVAAGDPGKFLLEPKAYTPGPVDADTNAKLHALIDKLPEKVGGKDVITKEQKQAFFTIVEASPDHAKDILAKMTAYRDWAESNQFAFAANGMKADPKVEAALVKSLTDAAIDYSKRTGGQDDKVVDALHTISALGRNPKAKDKLRTDLHAAAAGAVEVDTTNPGREETNPEYHRDLRRKKEAEEAQQRGQQGLNDDVGGGFLKFILTAVLTLFGVEKDTIDKLFGGGKDKDQQTAGAPAPSPAAKPDEPAARPEGTPVPAVAGGPSAPAPAAVPAPATPAPAAAAAPAPSADAAPKYLTEIPIEGGGTLSAEIVQKALIQRNLSVGPDGVDKKFGNNSIAAFYADRDKGSAHRNDKNLVIYKDELEGIKSAAAKYDQDIARAQASRQQQDASSVQASASQSQELARGSKPTASAVSGLVEIDDGHGHKVKVDPAVLKLANAAYVAKVEKLTGGEGKNGETIDVNEFNDRLAAIKKRFGEEKHHVRNNPNPTIDTMIAVLDSNDQKQASANQLSQKLLAGLTGNTDALKGGKVTEAVLKKFQADHKLEQTGRFDDATKDKLMHETNIKYANGGERGLLMASDNSKADWLLSQIKAPVTPPKDATDTRLAMNK